ncbi:MAG: zinc-ribbon domain-containing protein [Lachnospiraceae bacterium]|nr:zinc-ribbon domain-containing protein [Lachnospiraceae bacterium]
MAFFDKLKKDLTAAGQLTAEKAKKAADILALKEQIRQDKLEIRDLTNKIGQIYIELHRDDYEKDFEDVFTALGSVEESLAQKEKELKLLNEKISCPECGTEMSATSNYCPNCGTSAPYETELKEEEPLDETVADDIKE